MQIGEKEMHILRAYRGFSNNKDINGTNKVEKMR